MFCVEHCAAHAYVFIPIVWCYVIFLRWKRLYAVFFIVCSYMYCRWIPSYQEGSWDHINWLTPQPFCTWAKPGYWFPTSYVVVTHFCVSELKWEVIVHVADNSGMSYQNSFNFLFVIHQWCFMVRLRARYMCLFSTHRMLLASLWRQWCFMVRGKQLITTVYLALYHWLIRLRQKIYVSLSTHWM